MSCKKFLLLGSIVGLMSFHGETREINEISTSDLQNYRSGFQRCFPTLVIAIRTWTVIIAACICRIIVVFRGIARSEGKR